MKWFLRFFVGALVVLLLLAGGAYFWVTRPAFQKRMLERNLPEGSTVERVRVRAGSLSLTGLNIPLPDGGRVTVAEMAHTFELWPALTDRTVALGPVTVRGVEITLPEGGVEEAVAAEPAKDRPRQAPKTGPKEKAAEVAPPKDPAAVLHALGDLDWRFKLAGLDVHGVVRAPASGARFTFSLRSDGFAPGGEGAVEARADLAPGVPVRGDLRDFRGRVRLRFRQKADGGFEAVRLESEIAAADATGGEVVSGRQTFALAAPSPDTAELDLDFDLEVTEPGRFAPGLSALAPLRVRGGAAGRSADGGFQVERAQASVAGGGRDLLSAELRQPLTLGAEQRFTGELLRLALTDFPVGWLNPWLPGDVALEGAPLSLRATVSGTDGGGIEAALEAPLEAGPFTVRRDGALLLPVDPVVRVGADGSAEVSLEGLAVRDRYGPVVTGTAGASVPAGAGGAPVPDGLAADADFRIELQPLFDQPALAPHASPMGGTLSFRLRADGGENYPLRIDGALRGLRARDNPGATRDYRFAAQAVGPWARISARVRTTSPRPICNSARVCVLRRRLSDSRGS